MGLSMTASVSNLEIEGAHCRPHDHAASLFSAEIFVNHTSPFDITGYFGAAE